MIRFNVKIFLHCRSKNAREGGEGVDAFVENCGHGNVEVFAKSLNSRHTIQLKNLEQIVYGKKSLFLENENDFIFRLCFSQVCVNLKAGALRAGV